MAQLDPRIILGGQPVQIQDPFETAAKWQQYGQQQESAKAQAEERKANTARIKAATDAASREAAQYQALTSEFQRAAQEGRQVAPGMIHGIMGPEAGAKIAKSLADARVSQYADETAQRKAVIADLDAIDAWPGPKQEAYDFQVAKWVKRGADPASIPPYSPEAMAYWREQAHGKPKLVQRDPTQNLETDQGVIVRPGVPKPPAVNAGSFEDYVTRLAKERGVPVDSLTTAQIEAARKAYGQADDRNINISGMGGLYGQVDAEAIADAIMRGEQPPKITDLGRPVSAAVSSILAKKGYNLGQALTDWNAAQRHYLTLNGAQQTRLRQAADTAYHSLDVIDQLADQWKGGQFPLLNKVHLTAALNGVYGKEAQSIATQLEAQITDLTSELGNVYMGGNSPTDHALKLAAKNLSADWSNDVLKTMTKLARTNLTIRQNAIKNIGVIGPSEQNPYAPQPSPAQPPTAAPAASGPKVGERRTIQGQLAEWDGRGWKAVR